jgi:glutaredoxin
VFLRVVFVTLALALAYAVLDWATRPTHSAALPAVEPVSDSATPLVMYSLTTCAPCKVRAAELHAAGVPFTEYKIDIDADARARLEAKLRVQTPANGVVGTPIFEIADQLIFGNPAVPELQQRLGGAGGKPFSFFRS